MGRNTDVGAQGKEQLLFKLLLKGGKLEMWRGRGGRSEFRLEWALDAR